jgi:hypothetical protein
MEKHIAGLVAVLVTATAMAGTSPYNLSLTPDLALHDQTEFIEGFTLSVWGENPQRSLALGIINGTRAQSAGLCLGVGNYALDYRGCQWGLVNYAEGDFTGWQGGFFFGLIGSVVNVVDGNLKGVQTGLLNHATTLSGGVQVGLVNYADGVDGGVQIGVINAIRANTTWFSALPEEMAPAMVLVNWRF